MGIFPHQLNHLNNTWYLGNLAMANYYLTFDTTPNTEHDKDYIQVGVGPTNPNGLKMESSL